MYPISPVIAEFLRRPDREFNVKAIVGSEEYDNTKIVEFSIENSLTLSDEFELGTAIPSKLTIKMRTNEVIPANARIRPYLSLSLMNLTWLEATFPWLQMDVPWAGTGTDWFPLGEFFVDNREKINDVWTYTCYDKLVFADVPYISSLGYPATQQAVWNEICNRLGWTYDSSVVINSAYRIPVGPAGYSMRQVLSYIASANSASIYVDKAGVIKFKRFSAAEQPVFDVTEADYARVKQTNPIKTYTRVVVTYDTDDQLTYTAGSGPDSQTLFVTNPFATQAITNGILANLNGFAYVPITMEARGYPQLVQGDVITFRQQEGKTWLETDVPWLDMHIPWDGVMSYKTIILHQVLDFKGGLKMSIEAPSKSEQRSEFVAEGGLTQQVNNLNKVAVRENRKYYGATITRKDGIIIEREDHASKAVFNSDELTFYADGEKALWFDLPNRRFKFTGTVEGSEFIGGRIQIGDNFEVNNAGQMVAVDAKFSGEISASKITGSEIIGGSIKIGDSFEVNNAGNMKAVNAEFSGDIVGGTIRIGNNFEVDNEGFMKAAGGEFSGEIFASVIRGGDIYGTNIEGSTITGGLLRTSSGGRRIEIDAQGLRTFDGSGNARMRINTGTDSGVSALSFTSPGGGLAGEVNSTGSGLTVFSDNLYLGSNNSASPIQVVGAVKFFGNVSGVPMDGVDGLRQELSALWEAVADIGKP